MVSAASVSVPSAVVDSPPLVSVVVAARGDGGVVLLDRLGDGVLLALGADGRDQGSTVLAGDGVDDPGAVTGLFQRPDGAWVEVGHRGLVQILDADGRPPEIRRTIDCRIVGEGAREAVALASRSGPTSAEIALHRPSGGPAAATSELSFDLPIWQITALEGTADGRVVLGVELVLEDQAPPHDLLDHRETAVIVGADGGELDRIELETSEAPEESLRRLRDPALSAPGGGDPLRRRGGIPPALLPGFVAGRLAPKRGARGHPR